MIKKKKKTDENIRVFQKEKKWKQCWHFYNKKKKKLTAFFLKEYACFHLQLCALNSKLFFNGDENCRSDREHFSLAVLLTSLLDWLSINSWPTVARTEQKRDVAIIRANADVCTLPLINTVVSSRTAFT